MKKYTKFFSITLCLLIASFLLISSPISAKGQQNQVRDATTQEGDEPTQEQAMLQDGSGEGAEVRQGIENATQSLTRVTSRVKNQEIGEQIRTMTQNHERVQANIQTAFANMKSRSRVLKFFFGPSYSNAGDVKALAAQLRADAGELASLKDELGYSADKEEVQNAIDSLEAEADALETDLEYQLKGFSLFGWLNRILSGY